MCLQPLQQVVDLCIGLAIMGVLYVGALAEQGIRLIKQQHRTTLLGPCKHGIQVLLGLADGTC